jgi:hypothetical protein
MIDTTGLCAIVTKLAERAGWAIIDDDYGIVSSGLDPFTGEPSELDVPHNLHATIALVEACGWEWSVWRYRGAYYSQTFTGDPVDNIDGQEVTAPTTTEALLRSAWAVLQKETP